MAVSPATDSTDRSMLPGDDDDGEADGHHADEGRLFDDVGEDADLEVLRDGQGEDRQDDRQHDPDEIVENEFDDRSLFRGEPRRLPHRWPRTGKGPGPRFGMRHSTGFTGSAGALRLPQNRGSSTLSLVIAAPGIFRLGPQASMVRTESSPSTL